jgi:hypothetical protein
MSGNQGRYNRDSDKIWDYIDEVSDSDDEYYDQHEANLKEWAESLPVVYFPGFPVEWRENHAPGTGPDNCLNCIEYGCIERMFMGYCGNCAIHIYNGSRGRGFIGLNENLDRLLETDWLEYPSAYDLYITSYVPLPDPENT